MKIYIVCLISCLTSVLYVNAQNTMNATDGCRNMKMQTLVKSKPAVADIAENEYDVLYVKLDLEIANNISTNITGHVTTKAQVTTTSMNNYVFELNSQLHIDSVKINGQSVSVANNGGICSVMLSAPLSQSSLFVAEVFYHGQPANGTQFYSSGIRTDSTNATYTMSEPFDSKDWWPCKQSLQDKIDSADIWITVPDSLKAGANGLLTQITNLPGHKDRYEWKSRYPIDYYLISFAVASYTDYSYYLRFPNSNDSMLVQNYVYGNAQTLPYWKNNIDTVGAVILFFSDKLGRYPFWKEKYGHCLVPLGGGMENQTMTSLGTFATDLTAHELFHQWFGDHVTCATWKDIWLNEGFASYGEDLFYEQFYGTARFKADLLRKHNEVLQDPAGTVYIDDTTNVSRIFDGRLTYSKGASVVHTLRFVVNDDTKFFDMLKNYQQDFAFKTATTDQFKNNAAQFLHQNLDTFMNQWVYGEGYPIYSAAWNQLEDTIVVKLSQYVTANSTVSLFNTPVELKFTSAQGDTTVRVNNSLFTETYVFLWNKTVTGVSIDPNDWLLNYDQGTIRDITLTDVKNPTPSSLYAAPNPAKTDWTLNNLPENTWLRLYDINGKLLWEKKNVKGNLNVDARHYPAGSYELCIKGKTTFQSLKLIKQ